MRIILVAYILLYNMTGFPQCPEGVNREYDYYLKEISIEGTTNINNFTFSYENPLPTYPIMKNDMCYSEPDTCLMDISIPVYSFTGSVPGMRRDFLTLLKASEYPEITVGVEKSIFDCIATGAHPDNMEMVITLAGVQKKIHVYYSTSSDSNAGITISGNTKLMLTDFHLDPPEKALGLVRVRNEVFIKFDIVISNIQVDLNQALN